MRLGWLQTALEGAGARFQLLQDMDPSVFSAHFTQLEPLHFRDGGNIPPLWAQSQSDCCVLLGMTRQNEARGVFVANDSPIQSLEQLKGKRLAIPIRKKAEVDFRQYTALRGFELLLDNGLLEKSVDLYRWAEP